MQILCLQGGGETTENMLLNLKVVRANKVYCIRGQPAGVFAVNPGDYVGWKRAAICLAIKNICFTFLFPLPLVAALAYPNTFGYNRLCGSMVVQSVRPFRVSNLNLFIFDNNLKYYLYS